MMVLTVVLYVLYLTLFVFGFISQDLLIFDNILNDIFYGVTESVTITATSPRRKRQPHAPSKSPTKSPTKQLTTQSTQAPVSTPNNRIHATPVKHAFIETGIDTIIAKQAIMLGYEPGPAWSLKVLQLYTITQVKHGVCVCVRMCVLMGHLIHYVFSFQL